MASNGKEDILYTKRLSRRIGHRAARRVISGGRHRQHFRGGAGRRMFLAEALERRRYFAKRRLAAFELSTVAAFRGAEACLQRNIRRPVPPEMLPVSLSGIAPLSLTGSHPYPTGSDKRSIPHSTPAVSHRHDAVISASVLRKAIIILPSRYR